MGAHVTSIELRNDLSELERLTERLREFGARHALSARTVNELNLALEEVITNIILYGFDAGTQHQIRVDVRLEDAQLTTRLEDDGRAFDPLAVPEPDLDVPLEERKVGGLGILLVRRLMDEVTYSRQDGRNVLVMIKRTTS